MATAEARAKKTLKVIESIDQRLARMEAHMGLGPVSAPTQTVSPEQASELNRSLVGEPAKTKGGK